MMQVFIIAVEGNWFAGLLARLQVPRGKEPWHWNTAFEKLIRMLHSTLHPKGDPKGTYCFDTIGLGVMAVLSQY
jgi:hypothetical protein